jgi:hypothetical protein
MNHFITNLGAELCHAAPDPELASFHFAAQASDSNKSFADYVLYLSQQTKCGLEPMVYAALWIKRLCRLRPNFDVSPATLHRLFLTALVVAIKYCNDIYWSNEDYAIIGDITLQELNKLELVLTHTLLGWNLYVDTDTDPDYRDLYLRATLTSLQPP